MNTDINKRWMGRLTQAQATAMLNLYKNGASITKCASRFEISRTTVRKYIKREAEGCTFISRDDVKLAMVGLTLQECVPMYRSMVNPLAAVNTVRNFLYINKVNYFKLSV